MPMLRMASPRMAASVERARLGQDLARFRRIDLAQHEQGALFDERGLRAGQHLLDDRQGALRRLRHQAFQRRERELFVGVGARSAAVGFLRVLRGVPRRPSAARPAL